MIFSIFKNFAELMRKLIDNDNDNDNLSRI